MVYKNRSLIDQGVSMQLLQAWQDSLTFFYLQNLKLFILITIRSIIEAYKIIITYWWWLLLLISGLFVWGHSAMFFLFISRACYYLFVFIFSLATRPSVAQKNCVYFFSYFLFILPAFAGVVGIKFSEIVLREILPIDNMQFFYLLLKSFSYPTQLFFVFFFLDSDHTINQFFYSFVRAVKMTCYNYLICLFFGSLFLGLEVLFSFFVGSFLFSWEDIGLTLRIVALINMLIVVPLQLSIFANIYIKKLHKQFDYYF